MLLIFYLSILLIFNMKISWIYEYQVKNIDIGKMML